MAENYKHFANKECEYFPCHKGIKEEDFNCLFCYCPLYALGEDCGGNYCYTEKGIKNCTNCTLPHGKNSYNNVMKKIGAVIDLVKKY